jgi:transcriptional regulator with XRE-family HTH domain
MSFAELLKSQREASCLTQKELSVASGLTQPTIANYELGKREPTWAAVQKLADALGVSVEVFRETAEETPPATKRKRRPVGYDIDRHGPDLDDEAEASAGSGSVSHPEPGGYGNSVPPSPESPEKGKAKGTDKKKRKK